MRTSHLLCLSVYLQIWQGTNHIVVVTPANWVHFWEAQSPLCILLCQQMLLPGSPPHYLSTTRYPKSLCWSLVGFHFVAFCRYNSERWRLARWGRIECGVPEGKNWSEPRNVTRRAQLQRASPGKGWELNDLIWDSNWRRRRKRRRKSEREGKHQGCRSHCGLQLRSRSNGTGPQPQPLCTLCG